MTFFDKRFRKLDGFISLKWLLVNGSIIMTSVCSEFNNLSGASPFSNIQCISLSYSMYIIQCKDVIQLCLMVFQHLGQHPMSSRVHTSSDLLSPITNHQSPICLSPISPSGYEQCPFLFLLCVRCAIIVRFLTMLCFDWSSSNVLVSRSCDYRQSVQCRKRVYLSAVVMWYEDVGGCGHVIWPHSVSMWCGDGVSALCFCTCALCMCAQREVIRVRLIERYEYISPEMIYKVKNDWLTVYSWY